MPDEIRSLRHNMSMHGIFAGLTTLDVIHAVDHEPSTTTKTPSIHHMMTAGGPATNAAVTFAALSTVAHTVNPHVPRATASLLTGIGEGPIGAFLRAELTSGGINLLDAASHHHASDSIDADLEGDAADNSPAVSSIIEHPRGRMVASTNARVAVDGELGEELLGHAVTQYGSPGVVLVDGHNTELAWHALNEGIEIPTDTADPFAHLEAKPPHLRILDGGSWKDWFTPLLSLVDIAVISADFYPPLMTNPTGADIADFLRGFGIRRVVRTHGGEPVEWWWDGASGTVTPPHVSAASTLGAGDIFHGAFAWACALMHETDGAPSAGERFRAGNPEDVIAFACSVAALSTRSFGTRQWTYEEELGDIVSEFLTR